MTPAATFTELPEGATAGVRVFELDCRHGTTRAELVGELSAGEVLEIVVARHRQAQPRCRCLAGLRPTLEVVRT